MPKFKLQYRRILFIDRKIREGSFPNCTSLAREWEISSKTIQRDIDYLKYELDAPIEYDKSKHGFYYTENNYRLPAISMSESDLFSICIAERALKQFEQTPLYEKLTAIFKRIEQSLPNSVTIHPAWIDNRILFFSEPTTTIHTDIWDTIADAIRLNRQLKITHRSPGLKKQLERTVDPYHLVNFKGEWYLSSLCHLRNSIRTFAVSRIKTVELMDDTFDMPNNFGREKMFGDPFGIIWNPKQYKVRILFTAKTAPYIEERIWHPAQKIQQGENGSIVLEFNTNHLNEVKDWILSWGPGARVLAPKILIDKVKTALQQTSFLYK